MTTLRRALRAPLSATKKKSGRDGGDGDNSRHGTPRDFYEAIDRDFGFTIDVCADRANYKHPRYFDLERNGLRQSWANETFWCNPPYGDGISDWMLKGREEVAFANACGAFLLPVRTESRWWGRTVLQLDGEMGALRTSRFVPEINVFWLRYAHLIVGIHFVPYRLTFEGQTEDAPFASALIMMASPKRAPTGIADAHKRSDSLLRGFPR